MITNIDNQIQRSIVFCNRPVTSKYRYRDILQILPPNKKWPTPEFLMADHPCIIEFKTRDDFMDLYKDLPPKSSHDERPDWYKNQTMRSDFQKEIIYLLNLFTINIFYHYQEQRWLIPNTIKEGFKSKPIFGTTGYFLDRSTLGGSFYRNQFSHKNVAYVNLVEANKYFNKVRTVSDEYEFPSSIDLLFEKYFYKINSDAKIVFRRALYLYNNAIEIMKISRSISFSTFVSSIETLMDFDNTTKIETCKECGQPRYRVSKRFLDFMMNHGNKDKAFKDYAQKIYSTRSKILHTGKLFDSEIISHNIDVEASIGIMNVDRAVRICMLNWLLKQ